MITFYVTGRNPNVAACAATRFARPLRLRPSLGRPTSFARLRERNVVADRQVVPEAPAAILVRFGEWMEDHRGVRKSTVAAYAPLASALLHDLHDDPTRLTVRRLRAFVLARASEVSPTGAGGVTSKCRMFVRYLAAEGLCGPEMIAAVPRVASWRLATLPRYISGPDVERVLAACDLTRADGSRDRALLLLLARLGLRAGDVAALTLDAIDWAGGRLRVAGKSRREDWLPLPQEVGDALLAYLKRSRPRGRGAAVFFRTRVPVVPLSRWAVSSIVRRALIRAGVRAPSMGAHVLRHSAATAMLRAGASLHEIGAVLRHASIETTYHYAKADHGLLASVALPWPGAR